MRGTRTRVVAIGLGGAIVALGIGERALQGASEGRQVQAPSFEVDPFWPQPLPNHWVLGSVIGVGVDARDHVFIVHRQQTLNTRTEVLTGEAAARGECCTPRRRCWSSPPTASW